MPLRGAEGIAILRDKPTWDDHAKRVVFETVPDFVQGSITAREQYLREVPDGCDGGDRRVEYEFYVGDRYFVYGHLEEARRFLRPIYEQRCTTSQRGYAAWLELLEMSNMEQDMLQSRTLAEADARAPCAGPRPPPVVLPDPPIRNTAYDDGAEMLARARAAPAGGERDAWLRKAARTYADALMAAPGHKDAPLAAMRAASLYLELGEPRMAIDMYRMMISAFGAELTLDWLEHGGVDPRSGFKTPPRPAEYKERVAQVAEASEALARTYEWFFFAFRQGAEVYAAIARNGRFDATRRQHAARIAMDLYTSLGNANMVAELHDLATSAALHPDEGDRAEADYLYASCAFRLGSPGNTELVGDLNRAKAIAALARFHEQYKGRPAAARLVLEAAFRVAFMKRLGGDATSRAWFKTTLGDWRYLEAHPPSRPLGTAEDLPYSEYRADAESFVGESSTKATATSTSAPPGIVARVAPMAMPAPLP